jgi:hypothetical protein
LNHVARAFREKPLQFSANRETIQKLHALQQPRSKILHVDPCTKIYFYVKKRTSDSVLLLRKAPRGFLREPPPTTPLPALTPPPHPRPPARTLATPSSSPPPAALSPASRRRPLSPSPRECSTTAASSSAPASAAASARLGHDGLLEQHEAAAETAAAGCSQSPLSRPLLSAASAYPSHLLRAPTPSSLTSTSSTTRFGSHLNLFPCRSDAALLSRFGAGLHQAGELAPPSRAHLRHVRVQRHARAALGGGWTGGGHRCYRGGSAPQATSWGYSSLSLTPKVPVY